MVINLEIMVLDDNINHCFYCERLFIAANLGTNKPLAKTIDHIIPLSKNGTNRPCNLVNCCSQCNSFKGSLTLGHFITKVQEYIHLKKRYKDIPEKSLPIIITNAVLLIPYVEEKGDKLLRRKGEPHKKKRSFLWNERDDADKFPTISKINKLAKKVEKAKVEPIKSGPHYREHIIYLQRQTIRQFHLAKQYGWKIAKEITEPDSKFNYL